jgi:hypothetical protein
MWKDRSNTTVYGRNKSFCALRQLLVVFDRYLFSTHCELIVPSVSLPIRTANIASLSPSKMMSQAILFLLLSTITLTLADSSKYPACIKVLKPLAVSQVTS